MDLPDRESYEQELIALLLLLITAQGSSFWQGSVPSTAVAWNLLRKSKIPRVLNEISGETIGGSLREIGIKDVPDDLKARSPVITQRFMQRLAERVAQKHAEWQRQRRLAILEGKRPPGVHNLYDGISRQSDSVSGVTEVVSDSQLFTAKFAKDFLGVRASQIWRLDPRSNSCPTCRALAGHDEQHWARQFPKGPPAHPNCRCWLDQVRTLSN